MPKKLTFDELVDNLRIVSENIFAEAEFQPTLFMQTARYRVDMMRIRTQKEAEVDVTRARLGVIIHNKKDDKGKKVFSEGAVKAKIEVHSKVIRSRRELDNAFAEEELSKSLMEAYRQRNSAIKIIAEAQNSEGQREVVDIERAEQSRKLRNAARKLTDKRRSIAHD